MLTTSSDIDCKRKKSVSRLKNGLFFNKIRKYGQNWSFKKMVINKLIERNIYTLKV